MQFDLVRELPTSSGNENLVTAMDVFACYLFAYLTYNQDVKTNSKIS